MLFIRFATIILIINYAIIVFAANYLLVANWDVNLLDVFNAETYIKIATVPVGYGSFWICVTPDMAKIFVGNVGQGTVDVINGITFEPLHSFYAEDMVDMKLSPNGKWLGVLCDNPMSLLIFDTASYALLSRIDLNSYPFAIEFNPIKSSQVAVSLQGEIRIGDLSTGIWRVMADTTGSFYRFYFINYGPGGKYLFARVANPSRLMLIDPSSALIVGEIPLSDYRGRFVVNAAESRGYFCALKDLNLYALDLIGRQVLSATPLGTYLRPLWMVEQDNRLVGADGYAGGMMVVSLNTDGTLAERSMIPGGRSVDAIGAPDGRLVFAVEAAGFLSVYDLSQLIRIGSYPTSGTPSAVAYAYPRTVTEEAADPPVILSARLGKRVIGSLKKESFRMLVRGRVKEGEAKISQVTVNGEPAELSVVDDGVFKYQAQPSFKKTSGDDEVTIKAMDAAGNSATRIIKFKLERNRVIRLD